MASDIAGSEIYLVDPLNPHSEPQVVARFPNTTCNTAIVEMQDDVFYITGALGDLYHFQFTPNTSVLYEVDMRHYTPGGHAVVRKVADLSGVGTPNGMTALSKEDGTMLLADSTLGLVWRVNIHTGAHEVVFSDPKLQPISNDHPPFGVNGVHVVGSDLYFSNTNHGLICKVPISCEGVPAGDITVISSSVTAADDFAVDSRGNIWLAENVQNTFVRVSPDGHVQTIAGGLESSALIGPVAAAFGRGFHEQDILFISTDGLTVTNEGAPITQNGKIVSIDTRQW